MRGGKGELMELHMCRADLKGKKSVPKHSFPQNARRHYMCSTIGSQPFIPSPMGSQVFNHWFLPPHVVDHSTICSYPHMCSMIASQPYLTPCTIQHERK